MKAASKPFLQFFGRGQRRSLGSVLMFSLIGLQVTSVLIALGSAYINSEQAIRSQSTVLIMNRFQDIDKSLTALFGSAERSSKFIEELVDSGALDPAASASVEMNLFSLMQASPGLTNAFVVHPDGSFVQVMRLEGASNFVGMIYEANNDRLVIYHRDDFFRPINRIVRKLLPSDHDPRRHTSVDPREPDSLHWTYTADTNNGSFGGVAVVSVLLQNNVTVATVGTEVAPWQINKALAESSVEMIQAVTILDLEGRVMQQNQSAAFPRNGLASAIGDPTIQQAYKIFVSTGNAVFLDNYINDPTIGSDRILLHLDRLSVPSLEWLIAIQVSQNDLTGGLLEGQRRILWIAAIGLFLMTPFAIVIANYIRNPMVVFSDATKEIAEGRTLDLAVIRAPYLELATTELALNEEMKQRRNFQSAYERTFAVSSRGMARVDLLDLKFIHVNDRLIKMLNQERKSLMRSNLWNVFGVENRTKVEALVSALMNDREYSADFLFPVLATGPIWIRVSALMIRDHSGVPNHALVIFDDINEERIANQRLEKLKDDLHHVGRVNMMGQFAAGLAHELNQPLSAIMHDIDSALFLINKPDSSNSEVALVLQDISSHAERSGKIIRALREFIQKDRGGAESFSLQELLDQTKAIVEPDLKAYAAHIDIRIPPGTNIIGKSSQIAQVLLNLIQNALEASVRDALNACVVTVTAARKDDRVVIHVEDNGPGLPTNVRPFAQFESTRPGGMGLGLSICKSLVESNEGLIHYEVIVPRGARFVIEFPADTAQDQE